jgi:N-alpha-acetyltransferase 35, NatC auxiliary subunit
VTNTYHRTLLASLSPNDVRETLVDARSLLASLSSTLSDELLQALDRRLELRYAFLNATESPRHITQPELARKPWLDALVTLPEINSSHSLGKAVDEAFSTKLQRKLASTMPPRPIVQLSFDDAYGHLFRLFKDGADVVDILQYTDAQCLQVSDLAMPPQAHH